jgi:hypothetical protein
MPWPQVAGEFIAVKSAVPATPRFRAILLDGGMRPNVQAAPLQLVVRKARSASGRSGPGAIRATAVCVQK